MTRCAAAAAAASTAADATNPNCWRFSVRRSSVSEGCSAQNFDPASFPVQNPNLTLPNSNCSNRWNRFRSSSSSRLCCCCAFAAVVAAAVFSCLCWSCLRRHPTFSSRPPDVSPATTK